jgi:hypothetical protein
VVSSVNKNLSLKYIRLMRSVYLILKNLGPMFDALDELTDLSLVLQKNDITLSAAQKLVARQMQVFIARQDSDSDYYSKVCKAEAAWKFRDVPISAPVGKEKSISKGQFYQALADAKTARLVPGSERSLCRAAEILDSAPFPAEMSPKFGKNDLKAEAAAREVLPVILRVQVCLQGIRRFNLHPMIRHETSRMSCERRHASTIECVYQLVALTVCYYATAISHTIYLSPVKTEALNQYITFLMLQLYTQLLFCTRSTIVLSQRQGALPKSYPRTIDYL